MSRDLWIGGSPCSGKSTVAASIAADRSRYLYSCDSAWDEHTRRGAALDLPALGKLTRLSAPDRLRQPLEIQVADVFEAFREQFPFILADLRTSRPAIVEGAALVPELLAAAGVSAERAVWLVPTEDVQRRWYAHREWAHALLSGEPDAPTLFDTWMRRDAAFGQRIISQAGALGYRVIVVDGSVPVETIAREVRQLLSTVAR